jgi:hypothetical protein
MLHMKDRALPILAIVGVVVSGCMAPAEETELGDDPIDSIGEPGADSTLFTNPFGPKKCCVEPLDGIGGYCGLRGLDGQCCGYAECTDAKSCGPSHGQHVQVCTSCDYAPCTDPDKPVSAPPPGGIKMKMK